MVHDAQISSNSLNSSDLFSVLLNFTGDDKSSSASTPLLSLPIPLSVVAYWPSPNYVDPDTRHVEMFGWELGLICLAALAVTMRFYVRIWMGRPLWGTGIDDWAVGVALLFAIGMTSVQLKSTKYGYGLHIWDVKPEWIMPMRKLAFCTQILFVLCTTFTKLSILWFYLRLSASPTFLFLVHSGIIFVIATGISFVFVIIFQCRPIEAYWDLAITRSRCIDESAANIANAAINSFTDFYVFILPVRDMLSLRIPLRQRLSLVVLFSLGAVVCIAGCLRVWQLASVLKHTYDNTWYGPTMYILTSVECNLAIVCGCLPALKPLMAKVVPGLRRFSLRKLSGTGVTITWNDRRESAGKGIDGYADESGEGSATSGGYGRGRRGGFSEPCPYSDPTKLDPAMARLAPEMFRMPKARLGDLNNSTSCLSDASIPLYENILKSASRLPGVKSQEKGEEDEEPTACDFTESPNLNVANSNKENRELDA